VGPVRLCESALVKSAFLELALRFLIVGSAARCGLLPAMGLPATEGAAQVTTASVAEMGEEENVAVSTPRQAPAQKWLGTHHFAQNRVILQDQPGWPSPAIPADAKLMLRRNADYKKPNRRPRLLMMGSSMLPFYPNAQTLSRASGELTPAVGKQQGKGRKLAAALRKLPGEHHGEGSQVSPNSPRSALTRSESRHGLAKSRTDVA
jgi:hypothetical protein